MDRNDLVAEMLGAVCSSVASCCDAASLDLDNQKCHDDVLLHMNGSVGDGALVYDAMKAQDCLDTIRASVAACQAIDYTPCLAAFSGDVPPGGPCTMGLDCAKGPFGYAVCGDDGRCAQPARGAPGQPCSYSCVEGPSGSTCQSIYTQSAPGVQVACHSIDGLACGTGGSAGPLCQPMANDCRLRMDPSCVGGASCDANTGACVPPVALGAPCSTDPAAPKCVPEAYCASGVCQPRKPVKALCIDSSECESLRCDQGLCSVFSPLASKMCLAPGK